LLWDGAVAAGNSYTYAEAQQKCADQGARLATEAELNAKMNSDVCFLFCVFHGLKF